MKDLNKIRSWELITKQLGNELNEEEKKIFAKWLVEDLRHKEKFENAEKIWSLSDQQNANIFNIDKGWNVMHRRIHSTNQQKQSTTRKIYINSLRIAASILILVTLSYAIGYLVGKSDSTEIIARANMKDKPVILADGTKVYLNTGAHLSFPKKFENTARTVTLTGEAFFDVARNEKLPFIIKTPNAKIKVLGTSFNVLACNKCDSVQVTVKTGIVELSSLQNNDTILISKGNTGVFYAGSNKLKRSATDNNMNSFAWKTDNIVFAESHLCNVTQTLERIFGEQIIIEGENLKKCPISAEFKNQDLTKILEAIRVSHSIQINKTSKGYLLTGSGCK